MGEIEQGIENKTEVSTPFERPCRLPFTLFKDKKIVFGVVGLIILILLLVPFGGKSVWERLSVQFGRERAVNLLPNSGFEEGSEEEPAGWETKSGRLE